MKAIILIMLILTVSESHAQVISETRYANTVKYTLGATGYDKLNKTEGSKGINRFGTFLAYDGFPTQRLSIGAFAGLTYSSRTTESVSSWAGTDLEERLVRRRYVIGVHAATYLMKTPKLDVYLGGGIALGFENGKTFYDGELFIGSEGKSLMYDGFLGVNYFFSENLGLTGRFGFKTSLFQIGLAYRY